MLKAEIVFSAFFCIYSFGEQKKAPSEPKSVESYLLKGQRLKAINLLQSNISNKNKKESVKKIHKISEIFFTDKSQKEFELALSLYFSEKEGYLDKLLAVEKSEPYNLRVKKALALSYLKVNNCKQAKNKILETQEISKYYQDNHDLLALTYYCDKVPTPENVINQIYHKEIKNFILGMNMYYKGEINKAAKKWAEGEFYGTYSPSAYYLWKAEKEEEKKSKIGRDYVEKCQKISIRFKRTHFYFPYFCENQQKVAEEIKSSHI